MHAQATGDSPYSSYGFGDFLPGGQSTQAMMAGTGLALTEPYAVLAGNPASYAAMVRPSFEAGAAFRSTRSTSVANSATLKSANFTGFNIGVPFARGKWGLALGLSPYSKVGYSSARTAPVDGGDVTYTYTGSGGINRAFFGLGHTVYKQAADSLGNLGTRIMAGADLNFLFGGIEQTREAAFPANLGYTNVRAFSTLILRAPAANASVIWQGDLTRKLKKDADNWRWSTGLSVHLPVNFNARYEQQVTTFTTSSGIETLRDTVIGAGETKGSVKFPVGLGLGVAAYNARWGFTLEMKRCDWSMVQVDVPGYALASPLRSASSLAAAARLQPATEGNVFQRAIYRMGVRHGTAAQEVRGNQLTTDALSFGLSMPLNAAQTNSWLNLGAELGQRGTTDAGLIKERYAMLWVGITFTPWRGERWFTAPKIQ